jgi:ABC-type transporter Mla MlaB component
MSFRRPAGLTKRPMEERDRDVLRCEVAGVAADLASIDTLARFALVARRHGCELRLSGASPELLALIALVGLAEVLREE